MQALVAWWPSVGYTTKAVSPYPSLRDCLKSDTCPQYPQAPEDFYQALKKAPSLGLR